MELPKVLKIYLRQLKKTKIYFFQQTGTTPTPKECYYTVHNRKINLDSSRRRYSKDKNKNISRLEYYTL